MTREEIIVTVTVSYTLKNGTQETKQEMGWKVFKVLIEETEGPYFGLEGPLLPGQSITRSATFNVAVPNGLLLFAYPSLISDTRWDDDDLIWIITP
ncbi:MAG: hypothetical protein BZY87_06340 [SAR202 cluster bacterium Io17-Chloro-G6]|nr:MAG: hypothetical protein BZY87_06340 [SAR202 cluster bacterium Io17-Chloro-G6]